MKSLLRNWLQLSVT